jgi:hypothetical protein
MYTQTWNKYLPIIRILLKRAASGDQVFALNMPDFEKAGTTRRKTGFKFNLHFVNGRPDNVILQAISKDLATILMHDEMVKELFTHNDYSISMNPKFQLGIKCVPRELQPTEEELETVSGKEA